jgi:hypothetical protein
VFNFPKKVLFTRERKTNPGAFGDSRVSPNRTAVGFYDCPRQIQPQSGALRLTLGSLCPVEAVEDMGDVTRSDPGTVILHANHHFIRMHRAAHLDQASSRGIFDGVLDQVVKHL